MRRVARSLPLFVLAAALGISNAAAQTATTPEGQGREAEEPLRPVRRGRVPDDRAVPGRPRHGGLGRAPRSAHLLLRRDGRGRLEDDRRRLELGGPLRQGFPDRLDRRDRRRRVGSERRLRRHRRGADPRQRLARRRRVQVDRRGTHLEERRDSRTRARSRACACIRRTPTSSTSRRRATSGARTPSGASSVPRTAGRRGRRSCTSTTRRARRTSRWILRTRASSTPRSGRSSAIRGSSSRAAPAAACGSRPTAATPGRS